jgi:hypothetical protein
MNVPSVKTEQPVDIDLAFASSHALEQAEAETEREDCTIADAPDLTTPSLPLKRKGTTLLKAGFRQCRYIISETYSPAICCGAPTNGSSWCEEHRARVLVRVPLRTSSQPEQRLSGTW